MNEFTHFINPGTWDNATHFAVAGKLTAGIAEVLDGVTGQLPSMELGGSILALTISMVDLIPN